MIEHMNTIDALSDQISALLDLMMLADDSVDIKSIHTASEMCLSMHDELMAEVNKIKEIKCRKLEKVYEYMEKSKRQGALIYNSEEIMRAKADAYDELSRLYDGVDYYDDDTAKTFSRSACDVFCKVEDFVKVKGLCKKDEGAEK